MDLKSIIVKDASLGLVGGGGGRRVVILFKNFMSYILVTNSQMFPLLFNMFIYVFYKRNTLMNKNFRIYNYF